MMYRLFGHNNNMLSKVHHEKASLRYWSRQCSVLLKKTIRFIFLYHQISMSTSFLATSPFVDRITWEVQIPPPREGYLHCLQYLGHLLTLESYILDVVS